jgi:methionyl-tRNA formyltransferase
VSLRAVFMGTPEFATRTLEAIRGAGHDVVAIYTKEPRPAGRGMAERKSPVHELADKSGIPVLTPKTLKNAEAADAFRAHKADVAVVVAYGLLLPNAILDAPKHGCFNVHASLLPRWRGAAPINRAIMAGDVETGVAIMKMEEGLDAGPVAMIERTAIAPNETAGELHDRLAQLGAALMVKALNAIESDAAKLTPQSATGVEYAAKLTNDETRVEWSRPAREVHNQIRGLSPFPGAWSEIDLGKGAERLRLLRSEIADGKGASGTLLDSEGMVACGSGAVRLITVQRAGKGPMPFADFARGARLEQGTRFT